MAIQADIKNGMGLDEIIGSSAPASVYGSLKSDVATKISDSFNPLISSGITDLFYQLILPGADQQIIADAMSASLDKMIANLNASSDADLAGQAVIKADQESIDLTSQLLPSAVLQPELLDLVTTQAFKDAVAETM
jgi:hypothetical protein